MSPTVGSTDEWLSREPISLSDQVELVSGLHQTPLLFHKTKRQYIKITHTGQKLLTLLDGARTVEQVALLCADGRTERAEQIRSAVFDFFRDLRAAGALSIPPGTTGRLSKMLRLLESRPMLRLSLVGDLETLLKPAATVLARWHPSLRTGALLLATLAALLFIVLELPYSAAIRPETSWTLMLPLLLLQTVQHELAHGLICYCKGAGVREAGVGLLYYFIPVAYVDHTDTYRLQDRQSAIAIALAGPFVDLLWAGAGALVALVTAGDIRTFAHILMELQLIRLVYNLNPLLPSDGLSALEAATGELNLRGAAMRLLLHVVTRGAVRSRAVRDARAKQIVYLAYAILSGGYLALVFWGMMRLVAQVLR